MTIDQLRALVKWTEYMPGECEITEFTGDRVQISSPREAFSWTFAWMDSKWVKL